MCQNQTEKSTKIKLENLLLIQQAWLNWQIDFLFVKHWQSVRNFRICYWIDFEAMGKQNKQNGIDSDRKFDRKIKIPDEKKVYY